MNLGRCLAPAVALYLLTAATASLAWNEPAEGVDAGVPAQRLAKHGASDLPGAAYAAVRDGKRVELGTSGVKALGSDAPILPKTPFLTGSITKSLTALAIMQWVERGDVSLDDPIGDHLPSFADGPGATITLRQLLSHTSGYSTYQGLVAFSVPGTGDDALSQLVSELATLSPADAPGERWEYSNANYQVLGRLLEVLSSMSYSDYLQRHVLQPMGMVDSFVADGSAHPGMALGHRPWFGGKRPYDPAQENPAMAPQGGVIASARDLATYMTILLNGENDIISAGSKALMMTPASDVSLFYGLGWFIDSKAGTVWHSGSSPGVETLLTLKPDDRSGVVVLVNAGSGIGIGETEGLRNGITAEALGLPYDGPPRHWGQALTFLSLCLLPLVYLVSMLWAWRHRAVLRGKSGPFGLFSLWFPVLTTAAAAWVLLSLAPRLLGVPFATLKVFQPDLALAMTASAVLGLLWAVFRLALARG